MRAARLAGRIFITLVAPFALMGALVAAPSGASGSTCVSGTATQPPNLYFASAFKGVAVLSSCNVWAVGSYATELDGFNQTLIEHWNGTAWKQVPSPNPGGPASDEILTGVAALSATNIWAVGSYLDGSPDQTLIEHWNGTAWQQVPSPNPGGSAGANDLTGIAAVSATNIWAVGYYFDGTRYRTLVLHWNGTGWKRVWSPSPGTANDYLVGTASVSVSDVWAVGLYSTGTVDRTLIEHWDGTGWKRAWSPNPGGSANNNLLSGVAAVTATNVWAVGRFSNGTAYQTLTEHWDGTGWKRVWSPNPGGSANDDYLSGVAAVSSSNVWAVGAYSNGSPARTLIERWNGTGWKRISSPNPGGTDDDNVLTGVGASSATNIWSVGYYLIGDGELGNQPIALHCC
jgi:hypothetical protein